MKNKILIPLLFLGLLFVSSCEMDDSLDPLPLKVNGQFMRLDISSDRIDFNNIESSYFGGTLSNPTNNVVRYELFVRRSDAVSGNETGDYVPLLTVTNFPYDLRITPAMIAEALGLQVSDLQNGDFYRFYAYSYDSNGTRASYRELSRNIATEKTLKQAYRFNTSLLTNLSVDYNNYTP